MGFDCVWISPVVRQPEGRRGASGYGYHGYWAKDWYQIDPRFGSPADLRELSSALKARGMCLVLDIVLNHVQPTTSAADVATVTPFNRVEHYHTFRATPGESFDSYARHPAGSLAAFGAGCGPGDYHCPNGYNETQMLEGWFYDLADLNQSVPFVQAELLKWARHMVHAYKLDALRLDTAPYMPMSFLAKVQQAAGVEVIGEVTASNLSYLSSFTRPAANGGGALAGVLNFPIYYETGHAFCGAPSIKGALFEGEATSSGEAIRPSFHSLAATLSTMQREGFERLDLLANFVDNHDVDRIATTCRADTSRIHNALAFAFLSRGISVLYSGTEQGLQGDKWDHNRFSLWAAGYDRSAPTYALVGSLNRVRKAFLASTADALRVVSATDEQLVIARGAAKLFLFVNNRPSGRAQEPITYCLPEPLPPPPRGSAWVDALSGEAAVFDDEADPTSDPLPNRHAHRTPDPTCAYGYLATDGAPKALVALSTQEAQALTPVPNGKGAHGGGAGGHSLSTSELMGRLGLLLASASVLAAVLYARAHGMAVFRPALQRSLRSPRRARSVRLVDGVSSSSTVTVSSSNTVAAGRGSSGGSGGADAVELPSAPGPASLASAPTMASYKSTSGYTHRV